MLDRGQQLDWFSSTEIMVECALSVLFFYLFVVHTLTAKNPFIDLALFKDRNFLFGSLFGFFLGVLIFAVLALLPPMLEEIGRAQSELQSLMRISYAVFCLKKKNIDRETATLNRNNHTNPRVTNDL